MDTGRCLSLSTVKFLGMTETPSPSPARFAFTVGTPVGAIVVLIVAFGVVLLAVATGTYVIATTDPNFWFIPAIFLVAACGMAFYISRLFVTYTVDEEGFLKHGRGRVQERVLTWRDISVIRPQRGGGEGVELLDAQGNVAVKVHGALAGYEHLIEMIPRFRPDLWDFQGERSFQKLGEVLFLGVFGAVFVVLGIFVGGASLNAIVPKLFMVGIGAFVFWLVWGTPYKMVLRPNELELVSFQNTKRYTPADIQNIRVELQRSRNRKSYLPTLDLTDGKKVYLGGFAGGAVNTYGAVLRWWERGR
jgi:hypothetical protein